MARPSKPKSSRNKKTLERLSQNAAAAAIAAAAAAATAAANSNNSPSSSNINATAGSSNTESPVSDAANRSRSKSTESRTHEVSSSFEMHSSHGLPTTWAPFPSAYPALTEDLDFCMDSNNLMLDWDAGMAPPTSPEGALLPVSASLTSVVVVIGVVTKRPPLFLSSWVFLCKTLRLTQDTSYSSSRLPLISTCRPP
jgi:hypothetical protein